MVVRNVWVCSSRRQIAMWKNANRIANGASGLSGATALSPVMVASARRLGGRSVKSVTVASLVKETPLKKSAVA
jgi:hypothetical protein